MGIRIPSKKVVRGVFRKLNTFSKGCRWIPREFHFFQKIKRSPFLPKKRLQQLPAATKVRSSSSERQTGRTEPTGRAVSVVESPKASGARDVFWANGVEKFFQSFQDLLTKKCLS